VQRDVDTLGSLSRRERQRDDLQRVRRRLLARLRNLLLYTALRDEQGVFWVDADMVHLDKRMLSEFVASGKDVLVPHCTMTGQADSWAYDRNSWVGPRLMPNATERETIAAGGLFVPRYVRGRWDWDEE